MNQTKLHQLEELGQSIWLDFIRRSILENGELQEYVEKGLRGVTSNPSIFDKAISDGEEYDQTITDLTSQGKSTHEIYEALAVADIQKACDILSPVFEQSHREDGYVSLEANPHLAHDTQGTIEEAQRLWDLVDRPNLMIKVPGTPEGVPAIETLTSQGYNINVTLLFSRSQYDQISDAFISGLEQFAADGGDPKDVSSVASFFVSRIDVKIDRILGAMDEPDAKGLQGKIGIASAKMVYQDYLEKFTGNRWKSLAEQGARVQRVLYGSTSTKNPAYPDTLYADELIGEDTINTLPPQTLDAFLDHGTVSNTLTTDIEKVKQQLSQLSSLGINLENITKELLDEGVVKFANSFDELMVSISKKKSTFG
ncbi:MAG: transaldolase [Anaerolineales bacterium]|nr:transaldolase [Anaerolineales bacterium]